MEVKYYERFYVNELCVEYYLFKISKHVSEFVFLTDKQKTYFNYTDY